MAKYNTYILYMYMHVGVRQGHVVLFKHYIYMISYKTLTHIYIHYIKFISFINKVYDLFIHLYDLSMYINILLTYKIDFLISLYVFRN